MLGFEYEACTIGEIKFEPQPGIEFNETGQRSVSGELINESSLNLHKIINILNVPDVGMEFIVLIELLVLFNSDSV